MIRIDPFSIWNLFLSLASLEFQHRLKQTQKNHKLKWDRRTDGQREYSVKDKEKSDYVKVIDELKPHSFTKLLGHCCLFMTHSRSSPFVDEFQCLYQPNSLPPVSMLLDVSIHTKSNNICNIGPGEEGVRRKRPLRALKKWMSQLILQMNAEAKNEQDNGT